MRKADIDLTKRHLSLEETYTLASNLNRVEDVRNAQRIHSDADSVLGLILGDVVDRGVDGIKILLDIAKHKNILLIRGNHDDIAEKLLTAKEIT